jgi:hypothetical protein
MRILYQLVPYVHTCIIVKCRPFHLSHPVFPKRFAIKKIGINALHILSHIPLTDHCLIIWVHCPAYTLEAYHEDVLSSFIPPRLRLPLLNSLYYRPQRSDEQIMLLISRKQRRISVRIWTRLRLLVLFWKAWIPANATVWSDRLRENRHLLQWDGCYIPESESYLGRWSP